MIWMTCCAKRWSPGPGRNILDSTPQVAARLRPWAGPRNPAMAQVEHAPPSIAIKLVFCGPFGSGKPTNLHQLYGRLADRYRSRMLSLDPIDTADVELLYHSNPVDAVHRPTMFYDLLPIVLNVAGVRVILRLLAGPGHIMHDHTRRLVLRGADG